METGYFWCFCIHFCVTYSCICHIICNLQAEHSLRFLKRPSWFVHNNHLQQSQKISGTTLQRFMCVRLIGFRSAGLSLQHGQCSPLDVWATDITWGFLSTHFGVTIKHQLGNSSRLITHFNLLLRLRIATRLNRDFWSYFPRWHLIHLHWHSPFSICSF